MHLVRWIRKYIPRLFFIPKISFNSIVYRSINCCTSVGNACFTPFFISIPPIKSLCKFAKTSCFINISRFLHKHPSNEDFLLQQFLHLQERPDKINLLPLRAQRMLFIRIFLFFLKSIYSKLNLFSCPSYLRPIAACNHSNVSVEDGIPTQLAQITFVPYT